VFGVAIALYSAMDGMSKAREIPPIQFTLNSAWVAPQTSCERAREARTLRGAAPLNTRVSAVLPTRVAAQGASPRRPSSVP
jgi:hypothetical protein